MTLVYWRKCWRGGSDICIRITYISIYACYYNANGMGGMTGKFPPVFRFYIQVSSGRICGWLSHARNLSVLDRRVAWSTHPLLPGPTRDFPARFNKWSVDQQRDKQATTGVAANWNCWQPGNNTISYHVVTLLTNLLCTQPASWKCPLNFEGSTVGTGWLVRGVYGTRERFLLFCQ